MKRTIQVAQHAGYCFGVRRALDMAKDYLSRSASKVYSLGPIIHNPRVVEEFREKGLIPIDSIETIDEGVLVIRSHGVEKSILEEAKAKGLVVVDATCPFVKNAQKLARRLSAQGYQLVIVGKGSHPEVKGIISYSGEDPIVVATVEDLQGKQVGLKVCVLAQTTQEQKNFIEVVRAVLPLAYECRVFNTICNATSTRQSATAELASSVDLMFVVGGKNSANTARLSDICRVSGAGTYQIESVEEITPEMIRGKANIGITAGASTPADHVEAVRKVLEEADT